MFSRIEGAALVAFLALGCGANGDQVLGDIKPKEGMIRTDASAPAPDAGGVCSSNMIVSRGREIAFDLEIYFVIDRSASMLDAMWDKWDGFVSGFTRFLHSNDADGIGIGAGYFPAGGSPDFCNQCPPRDCGCLAGCGCPCDMRGDPRNCTRGPVCDWNTYTRADVDIGPMPENAATLAMSLGQPSFLHSNVRPALQGALAYASEHAEHNRNDRVAVVLVAGGPPDPTMCAPDMIFDCADVAGGSNIKTSVVAFDYNGFPSLEPIANRGGGRHYTFDSHREDVAVRFSQLVEDLKRAPSCQYELPMGPLDRDKVNVEIALPFDGGGALITPLFRVKGRDACNGGPGWYYDSFDHPTRIIVCDASCSKIKDGPDADVVIKLGCPTTPPPQ
jgi:hypothetical protein